MRPILPPARGAGKPRDWPHDALCGIDGLSCPACQLTITPADSPLPVPPPRQVWRRLLDSYPALAWAARMWPGVQDALPPPCRPAAAALLVGTLAALPELAETLVAVLARPLTRLVRAVVRDELGRRDR